jgi:hypothetical protein
MATESVVSSHAHGRRRTWLALWGIGAIAAAVVVGWLLWRWRSPSRPAANADPVAVARFVASPDFVALGFEQQREYCYALRGNSQVVEAAKTQGRLKDNEYAAAKAAAWIGGKLEHLKEFGDLKTAEARRQYIDKLLARRKQKKQEHAAATLATDPADDKAVPDESSMYDSGEVRRIVGTWSRRRRAEWEDFRKAVHERKVQLSGSGK